MTSRAAWLGAALALAALPGPTAGQLAARIAELDDGTARLTFATREGVEICDQGVRMGESRLWWHSHGGDEAPSNCRVGSAEVELDVRDGKVRGLDLVRRREDRSREARDLGTVPADVAARYFLSLAREGDPDWGDGDAVLTAVIADVEEIWRDLLALAREEAVPVRARKSALFWLGQEAAEAATAGLAEVAFDRQEDQDVREAAVFALSQRPRDEGLPILMDLARSAEEPDTRRSAMFWLAQSEDERVLAFFEEILLGRGGI